MPKAKGLPEASRALRPVDWAYLAGVIDSDGSIGMYAAKSTGRHPEYRNYYLRLAITNASKPLMDWLVANLGGRFDTRAQVAAHHAQTYNWIVTQMHAGAILKRTLPYMKVKTMQAHLAVEYVERFRNASSRLGMTPEVRAIRLRYWTQMAALKGSASRSRRD
jgi:hypothetical protein